MHTKPSGMQSLYRISGGNPGHIFVIRHRGSFLGCVEYQGLWVSVEGAEALCTLSGVKVLSAGDAWGVCGTVIAAFHCTTSNGNLGGNAGHHWCKGVMWVQWLEMEQGCCRELLSWFDMMRFLSGISVALLEMTICLPIHTIATDGDKVWVGVDSSPFWLQGAIASWHWTRQRQALWHRVVPSHLTLVSHAFLYQHWLKQCYSYTA